MTALKTCGHCGAPDVGSYDAGYGTAFQTPLCHPNTGGRPMCYNLVTLYKHALPCTLCTAVATRYRQRLAEEAAMNPRDGRQECMVCGKWVWLPGHICLGAASVTGRNAT